MKRLADLLDQKYPQFNTTSPEHSITTALHQMCAENVEYLIVLEDEKFKGILTEHDLAQKMLFAQKPLDALKVADLMSRNLPVADAADAITQGVQQLDQYNCRYMAVYEGFTFKGIVSESDLLRHAVQESSPEHATTLQAGAYEWNY